MGTALTDDLAQLLEYRHCSTESGQADSRSTPWLPAVFDAFNDTPLMASG